MNLRIGHGYDIHRLVPGRPLVLGGVRFATDYGLEGHSDADCLTHAICDALLGAAALPDLTPTLADADVQVRSAAVRAVAGLPNEAGLVALRGRLALETDAHVRAEIEKAVSR